MSKVDLKVVLLGMHDVGKTTLVERYLQGKYLTNPTATVGAAFGAKKVHVQQTTITLGIWDTAGAERYESMSRIYYKSAKAAVVCYDLTNENSFQKVRFWVDELTTHEEECSIYIVGTKVDLLAPEFAEEYERKIDSDMVETYAAEIGAQCFETSSKSGQGVDDVFQTIAEDYVTKHKNDFDGLDTKDKKNITLKPEEKKSGICCGK